jgi:hypothetical protein
MSTLNSESKKGSITEMFRGIDNPEYPAEEFLKKCIKLSSRFNNSMGNVNLENLKKICTLK